MKQKAGALSLAVSSLSRKTGYKVFGRYKEPVWKL